MYIPNTHKKLIKKTNKQINKSYTELEDWKLTGLPGWRGISGPPVTSTATTPANFNEQIRDVNIE